MSDKMEREIDEIMGRLGEPPPEEGPRARARRLVGDWTAGLRRTVVSRLPHMSPRQLKLASLSLVVLVAAGLFFTLAFPSLTSGGSGDGETAHESAGDQVGDGTQVDDEGHEGSDDEALSEDSRESMEEDDHESDGHEEGDGDGSDRRH